ncbi:type III-B CRISPR module RAMP protein Cmr1 [Fervidobacterium riparium]|uniref:CRISPR-associated protein Cmr1 n=1 Tax=Fervidobacterium gondwanense DSM 13020 TaxID=1121883 RepID=A0A1M7TGQ2_FERGO|nr:type III-B CRISPR module RAMP protein Cmr1 [Fervidobacterium gondwanense]UXF00259.1 hypothetical protein IB67_01295 [Fervidobacterium riparium]SHN69788.1 CRISPR-associated protein Cmr1 [Fervidobacterium gondwanense DSM 13020]
MIYRKVVCKAVTPIISKGPNKEGKTYDFGLTGQSIKGVLHYWFRAVAPRVINIYELSFPKDTTGMDPEAKKKLEKQIEELRKRFENEKYKGLKFLEEQIFGSQNKRAPFGMWVEFEERDLEPIINIVEYYDNRSKRTRTDYSLAYSVYGTVKIPDDKVERSAKWLRAGSKFEIYITAESQEVFDVIFALLKLTSLVGGFGAKTTKGFGQFEIVDVFDENDKALGIKFEKVLDPNEPLQEKIDKVLKEVRIQTVKLLDAKNVSKFLGFEKSVKDEQNITLLEFPNFTNNAYIVFDKEEVKPDRDPLNLIRNLYRASQDPEKLGWYRALKRRLRYYQEVVQNRENKNVSPENNFISKDSVEEIIKGLNGKDSVDVEVRSAFLGLPIQYSRLKVKGSVDKVTFYSIVKLSDKTENGRKTSPLRIIFVKTGQEYAAYCLILKSHLSDEFVEQADSTIRYTLKSDNSKVNGHININWNNVESLLKKNLKNERGDVNGK